MTYESLSTKDKQHLNGKISQFMDAYIRQHRVWTPKQMHESFHEKIDSEIQVGSYTSLNRDGIKWTGELAINWLSTELGKEYTLKKFNVKYEKDKPIADRKSPLVERIRFGFDWGNKKQYDISYGLKGKHDFIETDELYKLNNIPWTIQHVNEQLKLKYNENISTILPNLCESHLEKLFQEYWVKNYYKNENPCIMPEVCGLRPKFYYYKYKDNFYPSLRDIPGSIRETHADTKAINFRYDFLIVNFKKQKIAFVELDGFEFHKTRQQQTIDSIKRNNAMQFNIALLTFTSKRITEDIDGVFRELSDYLLP